MNDPHGLTKENMLRAFPDALKVDQSTLALAAATATLLERRTEEISRLNIYTCIDQLPEALLDILAWDFKVDWWDGNYTLEEKRQTLKDSWHVHRTMGTKAAVLRAISAIYPDTKILEWWEYGGEPYHFRILINSTFENVDPAKHQRVMERVDYYKPLRSILDETEYYDAGANATVYTGAAFVGAVMVDGATAIRY